MAIDLRMLLYSALVLLVSSIVNVEAQSCGGNYTTNYGVIMSQNYPDIYDLDVECTYRIVLTGTSQITISFETFELDRSRDDWVTVDCESNSDSPLVSYSWNMNTPPVWLSLCSMGRIYLHSDPFHYCPTRGFRIQYQASTVGCNNTVYSDYSGLISSPNYPQNYNNDENCTYSIWSPEPSSFTLTFQAFDLESDSDCQYDWVQIRCDNSSYILPKYCGSTLPKTASVSNCKLVLVWFHTDSSAVYSGFSLQYSITKNGCGNLYYTGLSGIITSPNYPIEYSGAVAPPCLYDLYPVSSVALAFQSFDLEPFINQDYGDYVGVSCLGNSSLDSEYYSGNTLPPLMSYAQCSWVRVVYYANFALSGGTGFSLKYHVNPLVAHSAITTAPKNFTVDVGSRVQLDCTSDAVKYYPSWTLSTDGTDDNSKVIASFCVVNSEYNSTYSVVSDKPGVCNLVIESVTQANAGIYTCIDVGLESASSVVTVLA